jgi:ribosomal protein S18 acetylase RimI-like enzyme
VPFPPAILHPLLPRHAGELMRLRHTALREAPAAFGTDPDWELSRTLAHYRSRLLRTAARPRELLLGAWTGPRLIGMNGLGLRRADGQSEALIYSMYVLPDARQQGIGSALLTRACSIACDSWELTRCRITVETRNHRARALYERHGFTCSHRQSAAFTLNGTDYDVDHLTAPLPLPRPSLPPLRASVAP